MWHLLASNHHSLKKGNTWDVKQMVIAYYIDTTEDRMIVVVIWGGLRQNLWVELFKKKVTYGPDLEIYLDRVIRNFHSKQNSTTFSYSD